MEEPARRIGGAVHLQGGEDLLVQLDGRRRVPHDEEGREGAEAGWHVVAGGSSHGGSPFDLGPQVGPEGLIGHAPKGVGHLGQPGQLRIGRDLGRSTPGKDPGDQVIEAVGGQTGPLVTHWHHPSGPAAP